MGTLGKPDAPRVLVTGASGFIGREMCKRLAAAGYRVRATTRLTSGDVARDGHEWVYVGEIGPRTSWDTALESVQAVVHLAGRAHVMRETERDALAAFRRINAAGTQALARAAARSGVRRVIFVSSVGVNGNLTRTVPFGPDDPPAPHNAYALSKWEAETALWKVGEETGLEAVVVRPPLVYGPGVKANFLRLLRAVEIGVPLPLASVRNRRSLIGLGNLVSFLEKAITHPAAARKTFLVADDEAASTPELIRLLAESMQRNARLYPFPVPLLRLVARAAGGRRIVDQLCESLVIDSSKARSALGWQPSLPLKQGLAETVAWYRSERC